MMHNPSGTPHQPVFRLVENILCKMIIDFLIKEECIHIIVYTIQSFQGIGNILVYQCILSLFQLSDIVKGSILRKDYFILPVQADQVILSLAKNLQKLKGSIFPFTAKNFPILFGSQSRILLIDLAYFLINFLSERFCCTEQSSQSFQIRDSEIQSLFFCI